MPAHYHGESDVKLMREMRKLAADDFNAWLVLNNVRGGITAQGGKVFRSSIVIIKESTIE
jgi:hypothetical protein